jgi:hypothetical protein
MQGLNTFSPFRDKTPFSRKCDGKNQECCLPSGLKVKKGTTPPNERSFSTLDHIHRQPALRSLFVFCLHIRAGLPHRRDHLIQ